MAIGIGDEDLGCVVTRFRSQQLHVQDFVLRSNLSPLELAVGFAEYILAAAPAELLPGLIDDDESAGGIFPEDRIWIEFDQVFRKARLIL